MSRPTNKADLIESAGAQFDKLRKMMHSMTEDERDRPFDFSESFLEKQKEAHWRRDKNLRDVLTHLFEWHVLLLDWVKSNQSGNPRPFLPEPYNWKTYGSMNAEFWKKHQATSIGQAQRMVEESHAEVMALIETFSDEELFEKGRFSWTGASSLGAYCVSATSSHYEWAMKKIKQRKKAWDSV